MKEKKENQMENAVSMKWKTTEDTVMTNSGWSYRSPTKAIVVRYLHAVREWDFNGQELLILSQRILIATMN